MEIERTVKDGVVTLSTIYNGERYSKCYDIVDDEHHNEMCEKACINGIKHLWSKDGKNHDDTINK